MFNVSFKVGEDKLANALEQLRSVTDSFSVTPLDGAPQVNLNTKPVPLATFGEDKPVANFTPAPNPVPVKATRRYKRRMKPTRASFGTQVQRANWLILQVGVQPFRVANLRNQAENVGIDRRNLYYAISGAIKSGDLIRVGRGLYQRTGQSFIESLGLSESA